MATVWTDHLQNRGLSRIHAIVMQILQYHVLSILIFMDGTHKNIVELYSGIISGFRTLRIACKLSFCLLLIYRADTSRSRSPSKGNYLIHRSRKFGWLTFLLSCNWLWCPTCGASSIIKPTRCTNFSILFLKWNSTCFGQFLCPSSGVFHCTHSNGICHIAL